MRTILARAGGILGVLVYIARHGAQVDDSHRRYLASLEANTAARDANTAARAALSQPEHRQPERVA